MPETVCVTQFVWTSGESNPVPKAYLAVLALSKPFKPISQCFLTGLYNCNMTFRKCQVAHP